MTRLTNVLILACAATAYGCAIDDGDAIDEATETGELDATVGCTHIVDPLHGQGWVNHIVHTASQRVFVQFYIQTARPTTSGCSPRVRSAVNIDCQVNLPSGFEHASCIVGGRVSLLRDREFFQHVVWPSESSGSDGRMTFYSAWVDRANCHLYGTQFRVDQIIIGGDAFPDTIVSDTDTYSSPCL